MAVPIAFQVAMTGTAINLASHVINKGVSLVGKTGNTAGIAIGNASTVTTSTGALIPAGTSVFYPSTNGNTNELWAIGTSADVLSVLGV